MNNETDTLPKAGDTLPNGAVVLRADRHTRIYDKVVVLAVWKDSPLHPFVVWGLNEETRDCFSGDYHDNISDADLAFMERCTG